MKNVLIRKTVKKGPVKLNISKSGIGLALTIIKGFFGIGINSKGPYISIYGRQKKLKTKAKKTPTSK